MQVRSWIASITCVAFTAMIVWPHGARAAGKPSDQPAAPATPAPAAPATASSDDAVMEQAKQHFEAGRNAYNAGDYILAIREFKAAEQLRPSPILAYNIGLANEKLGKRRVAVKYYKRYLEQQPNASNKAEVEQRVQTLEAEIAAQPPPAATTQPGGTAPQPGGTTPPQAEQPSDMPPPDPNAKVGQPGQPGYDPYASQPPPGQPVATKPAKKRSLWWIWLIVAGAVTVTVGIIVVAVLVARAASSPYYYDHGGAADRIQRPDIGGVTLFRF
jgi:tetratricopeptide (TPR) repeat protein